MTDQKHAGMRDNGVFNFNNLQEGFSRVNSAAQSSFRTQQFGFVAHLFVAPTQFRLRLFHKTKHSRFE